MDKMEHNDHHFHWGYLSTPLRLYLNMTKVDRKMGANDKFNS